MDQSQNGPGSDDGATTGAETNPTRREASPDPGLGERARETVRDAREQLTRQVRERTDDARESAVRVADERKRGFAEGVHALASAIDAAASSLSDGNHQRLAGWTRELSGRAHRMASYLEEHDTRGLVTDLEGSARAHPAAFMGTSFAAGLAAGRFLRASGRTARAEEQAVDFEFVPDAALLADESGRGATSSSPAFRGSTGATGERFGSRLGQSDGRTEGQTDGASESGEGGFR